MSDKVPFLLNWYANPYHTPIFVAKELGYFDSEGVKVAIMEPTDPSDVTELVGRGKAELGLKAMVHIIGARFKGFPIRSIGTLLDEPPTGLIYLRRSGIRELGDLKGRRIGYVGEMGKPIAIDLARRAGLEPTDFETIKVGMKMTDALSRGIIDAGIGLENFQLIEVKERVGEAGIFRIDQLSNAGCCCFCSIFYIANERVLAEKPEVVRGFMKAVRKATDFTLDRPDEAFEVFARANPQLVNELSWKIFGASLPYLSRKLAHKPHEWLGVKNYMVGIGLTDSSFDVNQCYTDSFLPQELFPILTSTKA